MITLYGFGNVHKAVIGATRDLRVQWALEELGLPYRVHGLDHTAGALKTKQFRERNIFGQLPVIDDDGFVLQESVAILLYLAEKAGATPPDRKHYATLTRWCLAAVNTVELPLQDIALTDMRGGAKDPVSAKRRAETVEWANLVLRPLEVHFATNQFVLGAEFSIADILMASTLRMARKNELLRPFERVEAYRLRCEARPSFERALAQYEQRLGVAPGFGR